MRYATKRHPGALACEASTVLTTLVQGMHTGIADRVFASIAVSRNPGHRRAFEHPLRRRQRLALRRLPRRGLPGATYHFVAATAGPPAVGALVGDRLVRSNSASGRGEARLVPFQREHGLELTGLHHFDLLNHPVVYAKLHDWLTG